MTLGRMPILAWGAFVTGAMLLLSLPSWSATSSCSTSTTTTAGWSSAATWASPA